MKCFKNIFKISIILILLIIAVGSVAAADAGDSTMSDDHDDFELDEDLDEDLDDDSDDDEDEEFDEDLDDDSDDDEDEEFDEDLDDEELDDDFNCTDFDYLECKILLYLEKYGNVTDENWTESADFQNEYQIYLSGPSNYTINETLEGYGTYVKIFDSITSTFDDYNLTENETAYLKFLIIYYLNHYGNVSANYSWNESDDFANFMPKILFGCAFAMGSASSAESAAIGIYNGFKSLSNSMFNPITGNSTDSNSTGTNNATHHETPAEGSSWWNNIIILILVAVLVILVIV